MSTEERLEQFHDYWVTFRILQQLGVTSYWTARQLGLLTDAEYKQQVRIANFLSASAPYRPLRSL